jgi:AraC family transcriptional regulator
MNYDPLAPGRFLGEQQSAREVGGLTLTEYRYLPDQVIPRHAHRLAYFCVVLRGSYRERYDARSRECSPSMVIFHPEGETHSDHFHRAGGHIFSVETGTAWLERVREHGPVLREPAEIRGGGAYSLGVRLLREYTAPDTASGLAIEGLTLEILSSSLRSKAREEEWRPRWLDLAEDYLRANFKQEVGLELLADEVGVNRCHLARTFRTHYQCSAGEFLRRLRIEHACGRLRSRETEIADLAAELGFSDASHFTRTFKRHTGHTPSEYRRTLLLP